MHWKARFAAAALGAIVCRAGLSQAPEQKPEEQQKMQAPMTKEQAKELFRSVDEILNFVSSDTKLPVQHSVKRKLISRDEVTKYLKQKFDEDESTKRPEHWINPSS